MINVVIPMAGRGSRFAKEGYEKPKPLIDVNGIPMIQAVLDNINLKDAKFFLILQEKQFNENKDFFQKLNINKDIKYITINHVTEGALMTVLFAHRFINNKTPLMIANSDQIAEINFNDFLSDMTNGDTDGSIMTFNSNEDKWSYVKLNSESLVTLVKEKEVISNYATTGIYLFKEGQNFIENAIDLIINNDRTNNEYYVAPLYNYMIKNKFKITQYLIDKDHFFGIGTPNDLNVYLEHINGKK